MPEDQDKTSEKEIAQVCEWIKSEIVAGKCLVARSEGEKAWNNACDRACRIIGQYEKGKGLFQQ